MDPAGALWEIEKILRRECALHERYLELLAKERHFVVAGEHTKVSGLSSQRENLSTQMDLAHQDRRAWMDKFPNGSEMRLTDLLKSNFRPPEARVALGLAETLRGLVGKLRQNSSELSQVVNNTLNLVNGTLSILLSAAQHVVRSYSSQGQLREQYHPNGSRDGTILKQA